MGKNPDPKNLKRLSDLHSSGWVFGQEVLKKIGESFFLETGVVNPTQFQLISIDMILSRKSSEYLVDKENLWWLKYKTFNKICAPHVIE